MRRCGIAGCNLQHYARGWCSLHYERWRRTGDTALPLRDVVAWCKCATPTPEPEPMLLRHLLDGPLPGQCTRCGDPVYAALTASLAKGRAA